MNPIDVFWTRCEGPIVFGVNDCCMTVADVILAAGGPDLMAEYRGRYKTRLGFVRAFRKAGYQELPEACVATFAVHGVAVMEPKDFDVSIIGHMDAARSMVRSPAFYHSGSWLLRTDEGAAAFLHSALVGAPEIYRVI